MNDRTVLGRRLRWGLVRILMAGGFVLKPGYSQAGSPWCYVAEGKHGWNLTHGPTGYALVRTSSSGGLKRLVAFAKRLDQCEVDWWGTEIKKECGIEKVRQLVEGFK